MGKARIFSDTARESVYQKEFDDEVYNAATQQNSYNLGSVHFSDQSGIANISQGGADQRKASLKGALFTGNIGYNLQTVKLDVATSTINLNNDSAGVALSVISTDRFLTLSTGSTANLITITGAQRPGQRLRLYNTLTNTVTIKHTATATVNTIRTPTAADITFPGNAVIDFTFDITTAQWRVVGNVGGGGGVTSNPTYKAPVRIATTINGSLATDYENNDIIDGIILATGNRILLKDQTNGAENGIYIVAATGAPSRAVDFESGLTSVAGSLIPVEEGDVNADIVFIITTNNPSTVGVTNLAFAGVGGDNLGNHTATQNLEMSKFDINGIDRMRFVVDANTFGNTENISVLTNSGFNWNLGDTANNFSFYHDGINNFSIGVTDTTTKNLLPFTDNDYDIGAPAKNYTNMYTRKLFEVREIHGKNNPAVPADLLKIVMDSGEDSDTFISNSAITDDRINFNLNGVNVMWLASDGTSVYEFAFTNSVPIGININSNGISNVGFMDFAGGTTPTSGLIRIPNSGKITWSASPSTAFFGELFLDSDEKFIWSAPAGGAFGFFIGDLVKTQVAEFNTTGLNMQSKNITSIDALEQTDTGHTLLHTFARPQTLSDDSVIGEIRFRAFDGIGTINNYAMIKGVMDNDANTSEDGRLEFWVVENGDHNGVKYLDIDGDLKQVQFFRPASMFGNSILLDNDGDTSIDSSTDNQINIVTGGTSRGTINNTGWTINNSFSVFGNSTLGDNPATDFLNINATISSSILFDLASSNVLASGEMGIARSSIGESLRINVPVTNEIHLQTGASDKIRIGDNKIEFNNPLVFASADALSNSEIGIGLDGTNLEINSTSSVTITENGNDIATFAASYMQMPEVSSDPSAGSASGKFYVKTVGGLAKPFFIGDGTSAVDLSSGGGAGANVNLSNLTATTINSNLNLNNGIDIIPLTSAGSSLGSSSLHFDESHFRKVIIEAGATITGNENNIISDSAGIKINTPDGDTLVHMIDGTANFTIDEDEIKFRSDRAHNIGATSTSIQIHAENLTDSIELTNGNSRSNATIDINDTTTTWLTKTSDTQAILLQFIQNNNTPLDDRTIGNLDFIAENSSSVNEIYARISATSSDITNATEDGLLQLGIVSGGTLVSGIDIKGSSSGGSNDALIGFFGETPVAQQTLSANPTNTEISTALRNLGLTKL